MKTNHTMVGVDESVSYIDDSIERRSLKPLTLYSNAE